MRKCWLITGKLCQKVLPNFRKEIFFFLILILFYGVFFSAYPADLEMRRVNSTLPVSQTIVIPLLDEEFKQLSFGLLNFAAFTPEEKPTPEKVISGTLFNPDNRTRIYSPEKSFKAVLPAAYFRYSPLLQ